MGEVVEKSWQLREEWTERVTTEATYKEEESSFQENNGKLSRLEKVQWR